MWRECIICIICIVKRLYPIFEKTALGVTLAPTTMKKKGGEADRP